MPSEIWAALIGAFGGVLAALLPILFARVRVSRERFPTDQESPGVQWEGPELVDIRQLRILRALAGENHGRGLNTYKNNDFYRPALDQLEAMGWVQNIGGDYHLTRKSLQYTRRYIKWLYYSWAP